MNWTDDLKQVEAEVRALPAVELSANKHREIFERLQAVAVQSPRARFRRRFWKVGLSMVSLAAALVLGVGMYAYVHPQNETVSQVQGAAPVPDAPKAAIYKVPAVGTSSHWKVEMRATTLGSPASTPTRPRYDIYLSYQGHADPLHNVFLTEQGIGVWKRDGTPVLYDTYNLGMIRGGRHLIYQDFTMLDAVPNLKFTITWMEGNQPMTEEITIPRH